MLNAISWQQYITAVILLSAAWYTYVGLRYYRPELGAMFRIKTTAPAVLPQVANKFTVVMGEAKREADTGLYPAEELLFAVSEPDDISDQTLPKGSGDELLEEAMVLVDACAGSDDPDEFLSLYKLLLDKYEVFSDEISLPAVSERLRAYAATRLSFPMQDSDWPLTF